METKWERGRIFYKNGVWKKKKFEEKQQKQLAVEEKKKLKELHYMKCPKCGSSDTEIDEGRSCNIKDMKVEKDQTT